MRRIFQPDASGLFHEIKGDPEAVSVPHGLAVIEAIVLLSEAELAQLAADAAEHEAQQAETARKAQESSARGQAALAKLEALGITADDIRAALAAG